MPKYEAKFELGVEAEDIITGFKGILSQHIRFITGCDQYCILPRTLDKEGKRQEGCYFDESRIRVLSKAPVVVLNPGPPGADEPAPRAK